MFILNMFYIYMINLYFTSTVPFKILGEQSDAVREYCFNRYVDLLLLLLLLLLPLLVTVTRMDQPRVGNQMQCGWPDTR